MRRLIGTGTTDSNGQVTIDYTGSGAGKVQLMAECGDIQSEQYTLYDVAFKDIGTEDDYTAWTYLNNVTLTRSDAETSITQTSSSSGASQYLTLPLTDNFCIEVDISLSATDVTSYSLFQFRQGASAKGSIPYNSLGLTANEYSHVKLTVQGTNVDITVDDTSKTPITLTDTVNRLYLGVNYGVALKYKNFIIYPI